MDGVCIYTYTGSGKCNIYFQSSEQQLQWNLCYLIPRITLSTSVKRIVLNAQIIDFPYDKNSIYVLTVETLSIRTQYLVPRWRHLEVLCIIMLAIMDVRKSILHVQCTCIALTCMRCTCEYIYMHLCVQINVIMRTHVSRPPCIDVPSLSVYNKWL